MTEPYQTGTTFRDSSTAGSALFNIYGAATTFANAPAFTQFVSNAAAGNATFNAMAAIPAVHWAVF